MQEFRNSTFFSAFTHTQAALHSGPWKRVPKHKKGKKIKLNTWKPEENSIMDEMTPSAKKCWKTKLT